MKGEFRKMRAAAEWEVELQVRWSCVMFPPEGLNEWTNNTAGGQGVAF